MRRVARIEGVGDLIGRGLVGDVVREQLFAEHDRERLGPIDRADHERMDVLEQHLVRIFFRVGLLGAP